MESWLIPLFIAEVVPAKIRGMLVSGYMIGRLLGTIIISCVSFATSTWPGDSSWKTPVAVLFSIPSLMILVTAFVPESPRWLLGKEEYEEALVNLKGLNDGRAGFDGETELAAMKANLEQHTEKGSWADLFRGTDLAAITPAEVPSPRLRGKTAMIAWTVNNFSNFIATFTLPYLMNPGYGNLGPKVGFIYGSFSLISVVWGFFYFPELKGRTLDEVDMMFRANVAARKTSSWKSEGYIEAVNHGKFEES
ncbi:Low-affinity glucose transporter HXT3 [Colletotrichum fructicola]|nr:Low-affinity glucose transporter HXT3 [Colletotrichum fructicola]